MTQQELKNCILILNDMEQNIYMMTRMGEKLDEEINKLRNKEYSYPDKPKKMDVYKPTVLECMFTFNPIADFLCDLIVDVFDGFLKILPIIVYVFLLPLNIIVGIIYYFYEKTKMEAVQKKVEEIYRNIPWNIDAEYQSEIDEMTESLNSYFTTMKIVWADYSAVDEAIERANSIDRSLYTNESLAVLDDAINSVERHCDVADELLINEYVTNIDNAVAALDEKSGDYIEFDNAVADAENIDRSFYTTESLARLDEAVMAAKMQKQQDDQSVINAYTDAIETAILRLEYLPADFSAIDELKSQAEAIDRTLYTPESLAELDEALAAVDYNLTIDKQSQVSEWVQAIESAIENLEYLPANYSAVETEISKANALDRRYYSELSLIALDTAVNAVDYSLKITDQDKVDAYAEAISDAINALKYASVVLRHEPCGVIVSATTKEIKPDTVLAVEEVDFSEHEGTNFAVGGSIRSLHFYDINLVYEAVVVQAPLR